MLRSPIERSESLPNDGGATSASMEAGVDALRRPPIARRRDELFLD